MLPAGWCMGRLMMGRVAGTDMPSMEWTWNPDDERRSDVGASSAAGAVDGGGAGRRRAGVRNGRGTGDAHPRPDGAPHLRARAAAGRDRGAGAPQRGDGAPGVAGL